MKGLKFFVVLATLSVVGVLNAQVPMRRSTPDSPFRRIDYRLLAASTEHVVGDEAARYLANLRARHPGVFSGLLQSFDDGA